jgi:amino acid transporter
MAFALIGTALAVGTFLGLGPTGLMAGWDATWGAGTAEKIISAAASAGWTTPAFSQQSTLTGMFVALFAYIGFEAMNYASGEVRDPSKSIMKGMAIGYTLVSALYIFITWAAYYAGGTLLPAYDYLFDNHPDILGGIMPVVTPSIPLFAGSAIARALPWVAVILTFTIALWFVKAILITFFIPSRLLFALSFDRSLSPKLSKVSRRGSPTTAIHISGVCALVGVVMWYFGGIANTVLAILDFMLLQIFFFFGLAATLFPYIRQDLYKSGSKQYEVAGIPVVTIFGVLTVATSFFIFIFTLQSLNYASIAMLIIISVIGLILYTHQQRQNLKEGIDINRIYTQIPPE